MFLHKCWFPLFHFIYFLHSLCFYLFIYLCTSLFKYLLDAIVVCENFYQSGDSEWSFWDIEILTICNRQMEKVSEDHCVKSVRFRSYSGPYFPAFGLNTERYRESIHIQFECRKIRTKITPSTETFYAVDMLRIY